MSAKIKEKELSGYESLGLNVGTFEYFVPHVENNVNMLWVYCQIRYIMMIEKYTTRKDLFLLFRQTRMLSDQEYEKAYNDLVTCGFISDDGDAISICN